MCAHSTQALEGSPTQSVSQRACEATDLDNKLKMCWRWGFFFGGGNVTLKLKFIMLLHHSKFVLHFYSF